MQFSTLTEKKIRRLTPPTLTAMVESVMPLDIYVNTMHKMCNDVMLQAMAKSILDRYDLTKYLPPSLQLTIFDYKKYNTLAPLNPGYYAGFIVVDDIPILTLDLNFLKVAPEDSVLEMISHELVHFRQWARGDLEWVGEELEVRWKGEDISHIITEVGLAIANRDVEGFIKYINLEHEREAYGIDEYPELENILINNWCIANNIPKNTIPKPS